MEKINQNFYFTQKYLKNRKYYERFLSILSKVTKPARYIGFEPYSIHKIPSYISQIYDKDKIDFFDDENYLKNLYRVVISYPDMYEIAMSNLTIKYFYSFINNLENVICERVFLPDLDLIELLKKEDIPLLSLESWTAIKNFNLWAFTVQTELTYSNILMMMKLAKLQPLSIQRNEQDPIIIAGGVSVFNPIPLSCFIDLFFIGEGEEAIVEIIQIDKKNRDNGLSKAQRIKKLCEIEGVFTFNDLIKTYYEEFTKSKFIGDCYQNKIDYIEFLAFLKESIKFPNLDGIKVKRRIIRDLNNVKYPETNILPLVQPIQDRFSVEVARGCLNGCRFCQASFIYRPYREKDALETAVYLVKSVVKTGYEECNLSSLSISDYTNLIDLARALEKYFSDKNISLSVPSLRVYSFDINLFDTLNSVRKAGLTFAVEAGCKEIRDKINKDFDEDKFFLIIDNLYNKGWKLIKLYFIIGFPEVESEEDKIIELLENIKNKYPKLNVNVSISLLIPKPFTPFQFDRQLDLDAYLNKVKKIKNRFRNSRISIKYHDPYTSYLEYFFANGGFEASYLLWKAFYEDICFDAWDEKRNINFYEINDIFKTTPYLIDNKISLVSLFENKRFSDFIKNERNKYDESQKTPSCVNDICKKCYICDNEYKNIISKKYSENEIYNKLLSLEIKSLQNDNTIKINHINTYLIIFSKFSLYRFVGHLDFYRTFIRLLKIGGIDFEYSKGFNPTPRIYFPFASSIGMESFNDIVLFNCYNEIKDFLKFCQIYNNFLPFGIKFEKVLKIESIKYWKENAKISQTLQIPVKIKMNNNNISLDFVKNAIEFLLKENNIEYYNINFHYDDFYGKDPKMGIINIKTEIKENQVNIVKLLNNSKYNIECGFFTKRILNIEKI